MITKWQAKINIREIANYQNLLNMKTMQTIVLGLM